MKKVRPEEFSSEFAEEVYEGLTSGQKRLSSAFFYDKKGDALFQEIMALPEYYLTRSEYEILEKNSSEFVRLFDSPQGFDLFELGAGDGKKTKILLRAFLEAKLDFAFLPIDISENALQGLASSLKKELPELKLNPITGTYFGVLNEIASFSSRKKVILFLGSNIGNLPPATAVSFLQKTRSSMGKDDLLFIGFDLKKDPAVIYSAYNDSRGVTAAFNKNILARINKELHGNFELDAFEHFPLYDPHVGEARSYLISQKEQEILIRDLDLRVKFRKWESIHTEISRKFDEPTILEMAEDSGLKIAGYFTDEKNYFRNYVFKKI